MGLFLTLGGVWYIRNVLLTGKNLEVRPQPLWALDAGQLIARMRRAELKCLALGPKRENNSNEQSSFMSNPEKLDQGGKR
jgi:hypothetical protein